MTALIVDALPPSEEEREPPQRRGIRKLLKCLFGGIAALALASFIAYKFPPFGLYIGLAVVGTAVVALILFRERPLFAKRRERALERELLWSHSSISKTPRCEILTP